MPEFPLVINFHTDDSFYREEAKHLLASCRAFDMPIYQEVLPNSGSWTGNCAQKGPFVHRCMVRHQRPLLWLDADAVVVQKPTIFEEVECDFAAFWHGGVELISACCYFNCTPAAMALVQQWAARCVGHPDVWDQKLLQQAVEEMKELRVVKLPMGYCKIYNRSYDGPLFIQQNQASRRFKRRINNGET